MMDRAIELDAVAGAVTRREDTTMEACLSLMSPTELADGIYFAVAEWDSDRRKFTDAPGFGLHGQQYQADQARASAVPGTTRIIRYSVSRGWVTTRRQLR